MLPGTPRQILEWIDKEESTKKSQQLKDHDTAQEQDIIYS